MKKATAIFLFFSLLCACNNRRDLIIQQQVQQNIQEYRKKYRAESEAKFLLEAGHLADSILLAEARTALADSLARHKPVKPVQPPPIPPIDSAGVKPIF